MRSAFHNSSINLFYMYCILVMAKHSQPQTIKLCTISTCSYKRQSRVFALTTIILIKRSIRRSFDSWQFNLIIGSNAKSMLVMNVYTDQSYIYFVQCDATLMLKENSTDLVFQRWSVYTVTYAFIYTSDPKSPGFWQGRHARSRKT